MYELSIATSRLMKWGQIFSLVADPGGTFANLVQTIVVVKHVQALKQLVVALQLLKRSATFLR